MSELLPCPFCGGEAETLTAESMNDGYLFCIMCNDCCSRGDVYDNEAEAIEAWNKRVKRYPESLAQRMIADGYEYELFELRNDYEHKLFELQQQLEKEQRHKSGGRMSMKMG